MFARGQSSTPLEFHLRNKRDHDNLIGTGLAYNIEFTLGGQVIFGQLDTGSSDIWVVSQQDCEPNEEFGVSCHYTFDPLESNSYQQNTTDNFFIQYADGTGAEGKFGQDTLQLGSVIIEGANIAVANTSDSSNVFGIGPIYSESCVNWKYSGGKLTLDTENGCTPYDNLPIQMKNQGLINTASYSIWFNDRENKGNLLFGGIDLSQVTGSLYTVPIERIPWRINSDGSAIEYPEITAPAIMLNKLSIHTGKSVKTVYSGGSRVLLDYGSTVCSFPTSITHLIGKIIGSDDYIDFNTSCNAIEGYLKFNFRGAEIDVPISSFVRQLHDVSGSTILDSNDQPVCSVGMISADDDLVMVLGDNVLSSMYTVFDYDNNEIGIGQASTDREHDHQFIEIESKIPCAAPAPSYKAVYPYGRRKRSS